MTVWGAASWVAGEASQSPLLTGSIHSVADSPVGKQHLIITPAHLSGAGIVQVIPQEKLRKG